MLRAVLILLSLAAIGGPAFAAERGPVSEMIAERGLAATLAELAARPSPDADTAFAIGAVTFLRGIERTLQTRWTLGMNAKRTELPVLRLPVPTNPDPEPFRGKSLEAIFEVLLDDMTAARAALDGIGEGDEVSLPLSLPDLWFDVNMNGTRDDGEGAAQIGGLVVTGRQVPMDDGPIIRFDSADVAWLAAYTHFLSAFSELVLAFEPAGQIDRVLKAKSRIDLLAPDSQFANALDREFGDSIDRIAMIYFSVRQQPVASHTRAAREHMLGMIADNRRFWRLVDLETDNDGEWIPNAQQASGLGIQMAPETGAAWLAVLDDLQAMLDGTRLVGHWRLREGAGINVKRLLEDPIPVDIAGWAHGIDLLPFAESGTRISGRSWRTFERMLSGDTMMMVVFLN